jgi:branched-chain amino acid aminotransferase
MGSRERPAQESFAMEITKQLYPEPRLPQTLDPSQIGFGKNFTPHYFTADYREGAWSGARIVPLEPFAMHPGALCLHYAQEIFEGLKAYRQPDGGIALFRPEKNARRFCQSAERMSMPQLDEQIFLDAVRELVAIEGAWVPDAPGTLYIRPTMVATEPHIGVTSAKQYKFFVVTLQAGNYFSGQAAGPGAVEVLVSESMVRAWPGGTGAVKTAANYALTLQITARAYGMGCNQVLFLDSSAGHRVEELGGMNVLFVENGALVTPPLSGTILPGVTRDSVLTLARAQGMPVREYAYTLKELTAGVESGAISEAIACGTAAVVTGIHTFRYEDGRRLQVGAGAPGPVTRKLFEELQGIQFGTLPDANGWRQVVVAGRK